MDKRTQAAEIYSPRVLEQLVSCIHTKWAFFFHGVFTALLFTLLQVFCWKFPYGQYLPNRVVNICLGFLSAETDQVCIRWAWFRHKLECYGCGFSISEFVIYVLPRNHKPEIHRMTEMISHCQSFFPYIDFLILMKTLMSTEGSEGRKDQVEEKDFGGHVSPPPKK